MDNQTRQTLLTAAQPLLDGDNWQAVIDLWQPYVDQGDVDAQAYLAYLLLWCFSTPKRINDKMRKYLRTAAEAGHADAMYWMKVRSLVKGEEADELLLRAGELGSRGAQRNLGALYATGNWSGPKDPARGVHWYRLAAERGHPDAAYNLGFMYVLGEGTEAKVNEGLHWLSLSAEQGNRDAMRLLSDLYRNGYYGVTQSTELAGRWQDRFDSTEEPPHFLHDLEGSL